MDNVIEWLNENELRAYPLREGDKTSVLPENFLLDLLLVVDGSQALEQVKLLNVSVEAEGVAVDFSGDGNSFFVERNQTFPRYLRNPNGSLAVFGEGLYRLLELGNTAVLSLNIPVEPAAVYRFDQAWLGVSGISASKSYQSIENSYTPETPLILTAIGEYKLIDDVEFHPGYNYKIDFRENRINMAAGFKFGLPMDCVTEFVSPELKDCDDIISYINGVPPDSKGAFRLEAGANIYTFSGNTVDENIPDNNPKIEELYYSQGLPVIERINSNTLFVGLTFLESDLCSPVQLLPTNN